MGSGVGGMEGGRVGLCIMFSWENIKTTNLKLSTFSTSVTLLGELFSKTEDSGCYTKQIAIIIIHVVTEEKYI